jgi:hypothetical protein
MAMSQCMKVQFFSQARHPRVPLIDVGNSISKKGCPIECENTFYFVTVYCVPDANRTRNPKLRRAYFTWYNFSPNNPMPKCAGSFGNREYKKIFTFVK